MKHLNKLLIIVALMTGAQLNAQQDIQFTQYMDNWLAINPAYAGSRDMLNAVLIHREQWVGMEGRPTSTTLGVHSPLSYESLGLGCSVVYDEIGPIQQTSFFVDFSYTLRFKNKGKLAFGVKGGMNMLSSRTADLITTDAQDPNLVNDVRSQINPNFGGGFYYHMPKFFVGISTPRILEQSVGTSSTAKQQRHYFLIGGGVFDITSNQMWKIRPTTQLKMTPGAPMSIDLSAAFIYKQSVWFGATHRFGDSFGAFFQYQLSPQFKAGLAYDQTISPLVKYNKGTYEVLLSYDFVFKKEGVRSPRYF